MGLTLSNNTPSAGYISWTACNMQYAGVSYGIPAGNTNNIYVYWLSASPNAFQTGNTLPTLGANDAIVFLNKNGVAINALTSTILDGDLIAPGSILGNAIAANTITGDNIAGYTIAAGNLVANTITADQIAFNTITGDNIAGNTITANNILGKSITADQIAANTILGNNIATNTINADNIVGNSLTAGTIAALAIGTAALASSAITADKISAGAVTVDKLNVLARNIVNNWTVTSDCTTGWSAGGIMMVDPSVTGMQPPMVKPILTTSTSGGSLPAATYFVVYTYKNSLGETTRSPESSITTTGSTSKITVQIPVWTPGVISMSIYISTSSGSEKLQVNTTSTSYTQTAALITNSAAPPTTNTALGVSASRGKVMKITTTGNVEIDSDVFEIDPTQSYKVTMSMTNMPTGYSQNLGTNQIYFGLNFYDSNYAELSTVPFTVSSRSWGTAQINPYFKWGGVSGTRVDGWLDMEGYMIATTVSNVNEVPDGKNVDTNWKIPSNAAYARIRVLNWNNGGTPVDAFYYSPSVTTVGSGQINAAQITAGTLNAITINGVTINLLNNGNFKATDPSVGTTFNITNGLFKGSLGQQPAFFGWMDGDVDDYKGFTGNASMGYINLSTAHGSIDTGLTTSGLASLNLKNLNASGSVTGLAMYATAESHFSYGTFTDPHPNVGYGIKVSGGAAFDRIMTTDIRSKGDFTFTLGNGQYMMMNQGSGAVIWRSNYTRLVLHDQDPTLRVERYDGGAANLIVATINGSSDIALKKNIELYDVDALHEINTTPIKYYNFKDEVDGVDPRHVGIILQEAPIDVVDPRGNGVDLYGMIAMSWKSIQQLDGKGETQQQLIDALTARVASLEAALTKTA